MKPALAAILFLLLTTHAHPARALDDAEALALEIAAELLAPPELVAQVDADLAAIRAYDSFFETIHAELDWVAGDVLVELTESAWQQYLDGKYDGLDALNDQYGPVVIRPLRLSRVLHLDFEQAYHGPVLAGIYAAGEGVHRTHTNRRLGIANDISSPVGEYTGRYTFREAWGDCPAGCIHERKWTFRVVDGKVIPEPTAVVQQPWARIKALYRE